MKNQRNLDYSHKIYWAWPLLRLAPLHFSLLLVRFRAVLQAPFYKSTWNLKATGLIQRGLFGWLRLGYQMIAGRKSKKIWYAKFGLLSKVTKKITLQNPEYLDQARHSGRGLILVTIHSPYFRLLQLWINQFDFGWEPYLIKNFPTGQALEPYILHEQQKKIFQTRLIDSHKPLQAARILAKGGTVLLAQDVLVKNIEPVNFLGKQLKNPLGALRLAEKTDSVILPVIMVDTGGLNRWKIHFGPLIDPSVGESKQKLLQTMEEIILQYPETWESWEEQILPPQPGLKYRIRSFIAEFVTSQFSLPLLLIGAMVVAIPEALLPRVIWQLNAQRIIQTSLFQIIKRAYLRAIGKKERLIWNQKPELLLGTTKKITVLGIENLEKTWCQPGGVIFVTVDTYNFRVLLHWLIHYGLQNQKQIFLLKNQEVIDKQDLDQLTFPDRVRYKSQTAFLPLNQQGDSVLMKQMEVGLQPLSFIGRKIFSSLDAANFAEKSRVPILPVMITNSLGKNPWVIRFWPVLQPNEGQIETRLLSSLETMVLTYPEAWTNWRMLL